MLYITGTASSLAPIFYIYIYICPLVYIYGEEIHNFI